MTTPSEVHGLDPRPTLDTESLRRYLDRAGHPLAGPIEVSLVPGGRSNLTFLISDGTAQWILRRPPLGHVLPTAHDMRREYTVMAALETTGIPVPRMLHLCEDPDVVGAPFLMMEYVEGRVIHGAREAEAMSSGGAHRCSQVLIEALAALHAIRPADAGLGEFGRGDGYVSRQIRRWREQWASSMSQPSPAIDELARILEANVPASSATAIVHGDYRLGNVILSADEPTRIAAIIDWEMATLGDPLADVGLLLAYWHPASAQVTGGGHAVSANPGFADADELIASYARRSDARLDDLVFHRVFGFFKLAVIAQTIVARHLQGVAIGDDLDSVGQAVDKLVAVGRRMADEAGLL